jgi:hypothetical protein
MALMKPAATSIPNLPGPENALLVQDLQEAADTIHHCLDQVSQFFKDLLPLAGTRLHENAVPAVSFSAMGLPKSLDKKSSFEAT